MKEIKIPFKITVSNHLVVKLSIFNKKVTFIIDTGASTSFIDELWAKKYFEKYHIELIEHQQPFSSANATLISKQIENDLNIKFCNEEVAIALSILDMTHINNSLNQIDIAPIQGILGTDFLVRYNAKINFKKQKLIIQI